MHKVSETQAPGLYEIDRSVELHGLKDESPEAESRSQRIQDTIAQMIVLGQKKGRPRKDDTLHEDIAA